MTEPVGSKNVSKFKKWSKPLIGTGLCAMSSMIYTIANVLVKGVSNYKPRACFYCDLWKFENNCYLFF